MRFIQNKFTFKRNAKCCHTAVPTTAEAHGGRTAADGVARGYGKMERALMVPIKQLNPKWSQPKLESAAQHCLSVYAGLRIMSRAAVDRKRLEGARDACLGTLT